MKKKSWFRWSPFKRERQRLWKRGIIYGLCQLSSLNKYDRKKNPNKFHSFSFWRTEEEKRDLSKKRRNTFGLFLDRPSSPSPMWHLVTFGNIWWHPHPSCFITFYILKEMMIIRKWIINLANSLLSIWGLWVCSQIRFFYKRAG